MKNGDHLICGIRGLHSGVLSVNLNYVYDTIGVQGSQGARLDSHQLFHLMYQSRRKN